MKTIKTFKGNFFEIGKLQGEIYKRNGMNFRNGQIDENLFRGQLKIYQKYYPELLREFEGIAAAGNWDKNRVIYNFITGEIFFFTQKMKIKRECTIFGVNNKRGIFIGRNYDWFPVAAKVFEVYKIENPERNTFIAVTDMGAGAEAIKKEYLFYNVDDAINDKGLFIGLTFAYNDKWSYGISCIHMTKLIAETCETVDEALNVFKRVPLCCPKNFFIADKNGDMVVLEHTSKRFKIIYPKKGILIKTNHYLDPELVNEDKVLENIPTHNTFLRYYETLKEINERGDKFQFSDIINILGKPNSFVCQNHQNVKTIWTLALDVGRKKYKLYWDILNKRKEKVLKI